MATSLTVLHDFLGEVILSMLQQRSTTVYVEDDEVYI